MTTQSTFTPRLNHNSSVDKAWLIKPDTMQSPQLLANDGVLPQSALKKKNGSHIKRKTEEELLADANSGLNGESAQEQSLQVSQAEIEAIDAEVTTSAASETGTATIETSGAEVTTSTTPAAAGADAAAETGTATVGEGTTTAVVATGADAATAATATAASSAGGIGAILGSAGVGTGTTIAGAAAMGLGVGIVATGKDDPANAAPVAASDTFTTDEEISLNLTVADLLGNDRDAEGNPLSLTSITNGTGGTVIRNADGTITFTPEPNFSGVATFSYIVSDGTSASTGLVSVNVTAVNDAPLNTVPGLQTIAEDTDLTINGISVFDADGSDVTVTLSANNGVLTLSGTTGLNFSLGSGLNDASMSFSGTQTDINLALSGLVYRANLDYNDADTITVTTSDSNLTTASSTIAVNVTPVNDAPVAADDILAAIDEDSVVPDITFAALTGNDSNGPANEVEQTLTITDVTSVVGGIVSIVNGQIKFTPAPDFNGTASFDYTVQDNGTSGSNNAATHLTDIGRVSFTVNPLSESPRLVANTLTISEGGTVTIGAANIANVDADTNVDSLIFTFTVSAVINGKFALASDVTLAPIFSFTAEQVRANSIIFIHNGGETPPSFNTLVTGTDNGVVITGAATDPTPATINFTNVNDAPVAIADTLAATEDTAITYTAVQLTGNDTDVENNALTIAGAVSYTHLTLPTKRIV